MSFGAQVELKFKKSNVARFILFVFLGLFLSLKARPAHLWSWACASSTGVCSTFFGLVDAKGLFQLNRFDNKMLVQLKVTNNLSWKSALKRPPKLVIGMRFAKPSFVELNGFAKMHPYSILV